SPIGRPPGSARLLTRLRKRGRFSLRWVSGPGLHGARRYNRSLRNLRDKFPIGEANDGGKRLCVNLGKLEPFAILPLMRVTFVQQPLGLIGVIRREPVDKLNAQPSSSAAAP